MPEIKKIAGWWETVVCEGFLRIRIKSLYSMLRIISSRSLEIISVAREAEHAG
jgi:hypothetical protein